MLPFSLLALAVAAGEPATTAPPVLVEAAVRAYDELTAPPRNLNHTRTDLLLQVALLRAAGVRDFDYTDALVVSGYATAFAYQPKRFVCLYTPPEEPGETADRLDRAAGLRFEWLPKVESPEQAWPIVRQAVDAGGGVQGRFYDDLAWVGYQDAAKPEERRVYQLGGWDEPGWQPWAKFTDWCRAWGRLGRIAGPIERRRPEAVARLVLAGMAKYAEHDGRVALPWLEGARCGLDGLEAFATDLADTAKGPDAFDAAWLGCHGVYRQLDGRAHAAHWLRRVAPRLAEPLRKAALAAANEYEAARTEWAAFEGALGQAPGLDTAAVTARWKLPANRAAGAAAVRRAAEHERRAAAALAQALAQAG